MLDTGIDVPEIVNLVFFKPVRSKTKFWQMVGRGTRLRPDLYGPGQEKTDFLVFDLCANFEYFDAHPAPAEQAITPSLSQRLFENRAELIRILDETKSHPKLRDDIAATLHGQVQAMNVDNFLVRPKRRQVEKFSDPKAWESLTSKDIAEIVEHLAPLPTTIVDADEMAKRFDLVVLASQLAVLRNDATLANYETKIRKIADGLLDELTIPQIKAKEELLREVTSDEWWQDVTVDMLEEMRRELRSLVRLLDKSTGTIVYTDFQDILGEIVERDMPELVTGTDTERFTAKVRDYLRRQPDNLALAKVRAGKPLTAADLDSLEELLARSGAGGPEDIQRAVENAKGLGRFIRSLVGLDQQAANAKFAEFLDSTTATANQIDFIGLVVSYLTRHGAMEPAQLYDPPFTDNAPKGPDEFFPPTQMAQLIEIIRSINASADVQTA